MMALETLKSVSEIDGVPVYCASVQTTAYDDENAVAFIIIDLQANSITFRIQDGPVKESGPNGCQVDQMVSAARLIIGGLNESFPCRENSVAITKLDEAGMWLRERTRDRTSRGVEGRNKA
jgi:hypothetical protein